MKTRYWIYDCKTGLTNLVLDEPVYHAQALQAAVLAEGYSKESREYQFPTTFRVIYSLRAMSLTEVAQYLDPQSKLKA